MTKEELTKLEKTLGRYFNEHRIDITEMQSKWVRETIKLVMRDKRRAEAYEGSNRREPRR